MRPGSRPKGFTLLELLIAMAIGLPLLLVGLTFLRSQTQTFGQGEQHMELARETALVSRVLFTELKSVHAPLVLDERFDLWLAGEADGRPLPNRLLVDPDGRGVHYWVYPLGEPGSRLEKRIAKQGGSLLVQTGQEKRLVSQRLTGLSFSPDASDPQLLRVRFEVGIQSHRGTPSATQSAELLIRLEGANSVVR